MRPKRYPYEIQCLGRAPAHYFKKKGAIFFRIMQKSPLLQTLYNIY